MSERLSSCCNATVHVGGSGVTRYYVCDLCEKACDAHSCTGKPDCHCKSCVAYDNSSPL